MRLLASFWASLIVLLTPIRLRLGLLAAIAGGRTYAFPRIGPASIHLYPPPEGSLQEDLFRKTQKRNQEKKTAGKAGQAGFSDLEGCLDSPLAAYPGARWHEPGEGSASIRWTSLSQ